MKIYIAGPITGKSDYREVFGAAERFLERAGHIVLNPAILPDGLDYEEYMDIGSAMLRACGAIYLLPGWRESRRAVWEYEQAVSAGKIIVDPAPSIKAVINTIRSAIDKMARALCTTFENMGDTKEIMVDTSDFAMPRYIPDRRSIYSHPWSQYRNVTKSLRPQARSCVALKGGSKRRDKHGNFIG